jgi:hypothetical protein
MTDGQECRDSSLDLSEMDRPEGLSLQLLVNSNQRQNEADGSKAKNRYGDTYKQLVPGF